MKTPSITSSSGSLNRSFTGEYAIEMLAAIVTGSGDAIISKNLDGIITSWNMGAEKTYGYKAEETIGKLIDFLVPPGHLDEEALILNRILKGEQISNFEDERICKDGRYITVSTNASPIFDSYGKVVGVSRISRDITIEKSAQEALREANKKLLFQNEENVRCVAELVISNDEKCKLEAVNHKNLRLSLMETICIARELVELRDPYTAGHEQHVGDLAKAIGAEMGLDEYTQEGLMIAGYLHDIGKIVVPAEILCKPGKLSPEEYNLIKNHVQVGYDLLKNINFPWNISRPVLEHHERLDGSGYPNHLIANQISIEGRIMAVADVVDAMSAYRPYRPALGIETALAEIERGRGSIYDVTVVDGCLKLFREKDYKIATSVH